jgi:hypothetical protein
LKQKTSKDYAQKESFFLAAGVDESCDPVIDVATMPLMDTTPSSGSLSRLLGHDKPVVSSPLFNRFTPLVNLENIVEQQVTSVDKRRRPFETLESSRKRFDHNYFSQAQVEQRLRMPSISSVGW